MSYTSTHIELAKGISEAYKSPSNRKKIFKLGNIKLRYKEEKSNNIFAHYENKSSILLFCHGAYKLEEQVLALKKFLKPSANDEIVKSFCKKYDELILEKKSVMLIGHSLGGWLIGECSRRTGKALPSLTFGSYTPQPNSHIVNYIRTSNQIQKVFFENDLFAKNLIKKGLKNALVIKPKKAVEIFNSHGLFNFTKPINNKIKVY